MNMLKYFITVAHASGGGGKRMNRKDKNDMASSYRKIKGQFNAIKDLGKTVIKGIRSLVRLVIRL